MTSDRSPARRPTRRRLAAAALMAVALVPAVAAPARAQCPSAAADPYVVGVEEVGAATMCLINAERREHGLRELRFNVGLASAGERHARDMIANRYFSHDSASGADFRDRILRTGFSGRGGALIGENLFWGSYDKAAPSWVVSRWMQSPEHRVNVLHPRFRELGVAVVLGSPRGFEHAATYAVEFGRRYVPAKRTRLRRRRHRITTFAASRP
jgi:uncharacterized protein YkwD